MVKIFSQTHHYDDAWPTVTLAFFLRYPNRYASHVVSVDVLSRKLSPSGTLVTTRLILKRGALPGWFPRGLMPRSESWIVEESEVDLDGRVLTCRTRNLDHVKIIKVIESSQLREAEDGTTIHKTEARFVSGLGWGLKKRIEEYSANKFKANIEKSRLGLALVVRLLRETRHQSLNFGNRMIPDGSRWNYHDIHAAALAPPSAMLSSPPFNHTSSQALNPAEPRDLAANEAIFDEQPLPNEATSKSRRGWADWLWSSKRDDT